MLQRDRINKLQQTMAEGGKKAFDLVPTYLANIINDREWEKRADRDGKLFASFEAFVTAKLWEGLESSIDDLRVYCRKHPEVERLVLSEVGALAEPGRPFANNVCSTNNKTSENTGATYTLKRLKRDRPDLAAKVISGELSANAAAIEAGFRKKPLKCCPNCGHEWR